MTDHCFLRPRAVLMAGKIDVQDAINLVVFAKLPLKSRVTGENLIAGRVCTDVAGQPLISEGLPPQKTWPQEFEDVISALRYPVAPSDYEPLLVEMVETGFDELPFFVHDHHLVADQRWRAGLFVHLYGELQDAVSTGQITVRGADGQRTDTLTADSWMSERTLLSYLNQHGVMSWWEVTNNLNSHDRLERILISDAQQPLESYSELIYDPNEIPSLLFAHMLLGRTHYMRDLASVEDAGHSARQYGSAEPDPEFAGSYFQPDKRRPPAPDLVTKATESRSVPREIASETRATPHVGANSAVERALPSTAPNTFPIGHNETSNAGTNETGIAVLQHSVDEHTHPLPARANRLQVKTQSSSPKATSAAIVAATDDDRMSKKELAKLLGKHPNSVDNLRKDDPSFPKPSKLGGSLRWRRGDVLHWLELQAS